MLNGFGGRLWSCRISGTMSCCAPNPYGNVGSLELSSTVTKSGSGDVTEEIVGILVVWIPVSQNLEFSGSYFVVGLARLIVTRQKLNQSQLN